MPAIRKVLHMARITKEGLEACMAFGTASLAVAEIGESVAEQRSVSVGSIGRHTAQQGVI